MKKFLCLLTTMLLVLTSASSAFANPLFDKHWNQGEYVIELTDEEIEKYEKIFRTALEKSEGTTTKAVFDASSYEKDYQYYLEHGPFQTRKFDDIGELLGICGLTDDQSISQQQVLYIAYRVLQEQYGLSDEQLTMLLPFWTFAVPDPDNPIWVVILKEYDFSDSFNWYSFVYVYAHDGSIWGVRGTDEEAVG